MFWFCFCFCFGFFCFFLLSKHLGSRGERWTGSRQSVGALEASQQWGLCFETLKHLFTTSPQHCYSPTLWALESHWWQMRPDETSVKNISKHTLSLFLYSYESTRRVRNICFPVKRFICQCLSSSLISIFCLFLCVCVFFFPLDCKQSAARWREPPVRWSQPVESATGKETGRRVNLHHTDAYTMRFFAFNISFFSPSFSFSSPIAVFT